MPLEGNHVQASTLLVTNALPVLGGSPIRLHSPSLGDAEGLASLTLSDLAATFQQAHKLASSPVFEFSIFEDLVGEGEMDAEVAAALNLDPIMGEVLTHLWQEVLFLPRLGVHEEIVRVLPTEGGTSPRHEEVRDEVGAIYPLLETPPIIVSGAIPLR